MAFPRLTRCELACLPPLGAPAETKFSAPHAVLFQGCAQRRSIAPPRLTGCEACLPRSLPSRTARRVRPNSARPTPCCFRAVPRAVVHRQFLDSQDAKLACLARFPPLGAPAEAKLCAPRRAISGRCTDPWSIVTSSINRMRSLLASLASPPLGAPAETKFCVPHAVLFQGGAQSRGPYAAPRFKGCKACLPRSLPSARRAA